MQNPEVQTSRMNRRGFLTVMAGAALAIGARQVGVASAAAPVAQECGPLSTDGRDPFCVTTENPLRGQAYLGGFWFKDMNGNGKFNPEAGDEAIQGVKNRQILVEEIEFAGWGDFVQLNPNSRTVRQDGRVSYRDVKAGRNSGERFVDRWTVFRIPSDGGIGIGYDLRTGSDRLVVAVAAGEKVDKVWAPIDNGKRFDRHECSGECGWNCVRFIQFSRLKAGTPVDLSGVVSNDSIHRDQNTGLLSSYTDYLWLWEGDLSNNRRDYNHISSALTEELERSEGVVKSTVFIPRKIVSYDNHSR